MRDLSLALGKLLRDGGTVPAAEVNVATTAHVTLVALLRTVHDDMLHPRPSTLHTDLEEIDRHPVRALGRMLARQPRGPVEPLSRLDRYPPSSTTGLRWLRVIKHATIAEHEWSEARDTGLPIGDARWSETADVAALARAVAVLNDDIGQSLHDAGQLMPAVEFRSAAHGGLELAARETAALAAAGPLPAAPELDRAIVRVRPLVTNDVNHLPIVLDRLGRLVRQKPGPSPAHLDNVLVLLTRTGLAAADSVALAGFTELAGTLSAHADRLSALPPLTRRMRTAHTPPQDTAIQVQVVNDLLNTGTRGRSRLPVSVSRACAEPLLSTSIAVADTVERQLRTGQWLVPREGNRGPAFGFSRGPDDRPSSVAALRRAVADSPLHSLAEQLAPAAATLSSTPRAILSGPLTARAQRITRPAAPGNHRHPPPSSRPSRR